jgi:hypothetical protein
MTKSRKVLVAGGVIALVVATYVALYVPRVHVLDQRLRLYNTKTSYGTAHCMFHGNQVEGRLREWLQGAGFPVKTLPKTTVRTEADAFAFLVRYAGSFPVDDLTHLRAELADISGKVTPLRWQGGYSDPARNEYLTVWVLDTAWNGPGPYNVRVKLPEPQGYLLDLRVRKL